MFFQLAAKNINKLWNTRVNIFFFGIFSLILTLSTSVAFAQRSVFVMPISLFGGTAAGIAIDKDDNLYIAENKNNRNISPQGPFVSKVTPSGAKSFFVPQNVLGDVTDLAFDSEGNLYVADGRGNGNGQPAARNKVWKVTPDGTISTFIPFVNNPCGLAFDSQGTCMLLPMGQMLYTNTRQAVFYRIL